MVIVRSFLALLAGVACMAILIIAVATILRRVAPEWTGEPAHPQPAYAFVNMGYTFLAAAAGGYVTAWAADFSPLNAMLALAVIVLALGAISALQARGSQPVWFQLALVVIAPLGVIAGGLIRLRVLGVL